MNKRMIKLNKRINNYFKITLLPFIIISFVLNALGIVFSKIDGYYIISNILFLISLLFTGIPILYKAIQSLIAKIIGIELLVSIAVICAVIIKEYSEAGIVCFLFQFGYFIELKTLEKTRGAIKELIKKAPKTATIIENGIETEIDVDEVFVGDNIVLHAGNVVPVDGIIINGSGYFIESSITGESKPLYKEQKDLIYAGSIVDDGDLVMEVMKTSDESTYQKIISLVEQASDKKSKMERFIDKFAKYYTPFVIILSIATLLIKFFITKKWDIDTSITVLVLACPGALVIGVPVASVAGIGKASKNNILLKGGDMIRLLAKTNIFVFDKTGTLTKGNCKVIKDYYYNICEEDKKIIASMEKSSTHPLSKAIIERLNMLTINLETTTIKGKGICYKNYLVGNLRLMEDNNIEIPADEIVDKIMNNGSSIVLASKNKKVIAIFEIADEIKDDSKQMIDYLKKNNKRIILLSGDNHLVCKKVCDSLKIDEYYSELLPKDKLEKIEQLKKEGIVAFIGDGINDSPAIVASNVGVSLGKATEVAIESSDMLLINNNMEDLIKAIKITKKTTRISYENIFISIFTVLILLVGLFLNYIHMAIGMLIHEASILLVILNALRILMKGKKII